MQQIDSTTPTKANGATSRAVWPGLPLGTGLPSGTLLALIVLAGGIVRFWNLNWDGGAYSLHPDEWALNEVVRHIFPDPNPHFFFYGSFPIYLYRFTADGLGYLTGLNWLDPVRLSHVGRFYSAAESTAMIPLLFLIGRRLRSAMSGLVAATCAAAAALLIQAAHFGTVDTLLTLEGVAVLWASLNIISKPQPRVYVFAGIVIGLAVSTKLTAGSFALMPLIAHFAGRPSLNGTLTIARFTHRPLDTRYSILGIHKGLLILGATAVAACLLTSPYYLLDWPGLWQAITEQSGELGGANLSYTWQFIGSTPYLFELQNLVTWGLGLPLGLAALVGWAACIVQTVRKRSPFLLVLTLWPTLYLLLIGTWQARFVRHTLPLVPFACLFCAYGLTALVAPRAIRRPSLKGTLTTRRIRPLIDGMLIGRRIIAGIVLAGACAWGLAFFSIYATPDTRLAASAWIEANVPAGSSLVLEDKNQPLPVLPRGGISSAYKYHVLAVLDPDSPAKMNDFADSLAEGDVLVVPNRRWSAVLPRMPGFPLTGRYYKLLFDGTLGYTPLTTFASPPRLGPIEWPDDSAEETFQVFDHPTVRLFQNSAHLPVGTLSALLNGK